jgi:hypothetical protein
VITSSDEKPAVASASVGASRKERHLAGDYKPDDAAQQVGAHEHSAASDPSESASFIDTFASLEDLVRFQSPRFSSLLAVFKAEIVLSRKALFVSVGLTVLSILVAFTMWGLANAFIVALLMRVGVILSIALLIVFIIHGILLAYAISQLRQAIDKVSISKSLNALKKKEQ